MNSNCEEYYINLKKWYEESNKLREIIISCNLEEAFKWGKPCYVYNGNNIVILLALKEYICLLFAKGSLLKDPARILYQPTENTQAARQLRLRNIEEIIENEEVIKKYIMEAVEIEKLGLKVEFKKTTEFKFPEELENKFSEMPEIKTAFEKLTPGRQRAYILYFSAPKQSQTKVSRIEKYIQKILSGKGLDD